MASQCPPCTLTDGIIDALPDDSPIDAVDLLEEHGIGTENVETTREAQDLLRQHLRSMRGNIFMCKHCDLISEDFAVDFTDTKAKSLLAKHHITVEWRSLDEARAMLEHHLQTKNELLEEQLLSLYGPEQVASIVQDLVERNRNGRQMLSAKLREIREYIAELPAKRLPDVRRQLPQLDADLDFVERQLQRDNFTIMVAGETGSGKSCLLNLLLGELGSELLAVNNLPSTSVITEIKYGKEGMIKAHQSGRGGSKRPHCQPLEKDTAPDTIAKFTHEKGDRTYFKYDRVEVFWPCEWIKNGITITDTPGVGENEELTQMVKDYIPKAFGFIYVINTPNAGGINPEELEDLLFYHITKEGIAPDEKLAVGEHAAHVQFNPRSAIFVCNKWDLVNAEERQEIKEHINTKLKKVWRDFDFDQQVFFLSAQKTKEELKTGHVSKEFRRLLRGVQNLLPAGFKMKLEKQFWSMYHIMERCSWVLKNFILCGNDSSVKKMKRRQYKEARVRLKDLETRPDTARREMSAMLEEEVSFTINRIRTHMKSPEVQERLKDWKESECPDNDNMERLQSLQNSLAQQRIRREVTRFEEEGGLFEGIQKRLLERFQSVFLSVDSELASIENALQNEEDLTSLVQVFNQGIHLDAELQSRPSRKQMADVQTNPGAWVSLGMVVKMFVLPVSAFNAMQSNRRARRALAAYRQDKPKEMAVITGQVLQDFLNSDKLQEVISRKLENLRSNFNKLFERIPALIKANQRLLSELETELDEDQHFHEYIEIHNKGVRLQDSMNFLYMSQVRTYEIDMSEITDKRLIGEGNFAKVKKGMYHKGGKTFEVAMKQLKKPLDNETATDFMTEEMNLRRVQGPNIVRFIGTTYKRKGDRFYPIIVQEYCPLNFADLIYNPDKYRGPGSVAETDPLRVQWAYRAAEYSDEISRALMAMHSMGFVHRDLKPDNILISTRNGRDTIKLCDLGISKREADIVKSRAGTPLYMAPEVLRSRHYDRSADIFSLGFICWEIWYGSPIAKISADDDYKMFKHDPFRQNSPPLEWRCLIEKCWASEPAGRPTALDCAQTFTKYYSQSVETTDFAQIKEILSQMKKETKSVSSEEEHLDESDEEVQTPTPGPESGEVELCWIEGVGLDNIVSKFKQGEEISEVELEEETASLTDNQAEAVFKRVAILNKTIQQMRTLKVKPDIAVADTSEVDRTVKGFDNLQVGDGGRPREEDEDKTLNTATLIPEHGLDQPAAPRKLPGRCHTQRRTLMATKYIPRTLIVTPSDLDPTDPLGLQTFPQLKKKKNDLPNFSLPAEVLGLTRVSDLSLDDLQKVRRLSVLELTALYDSYGLTYLPLKKKKKIKEKGVFGVPLHVLYKSDLKKDSSLHVPQFYKEIVQHIEQCGLEEEGILRVAGSKGRVRQIRADIDQKFRSGKFSWDEVNLQEATDMFKQLVRELPEPLMSREHFNAFSLIETIPDYSRKLQLQALNLLVLMLPTVHRNTLRLILRLLQRIVNCEENLMTEHNVCMMMSPNLFPAQSTQAPGMEVIFMSKMTSITEMLLKYQDLLWTVPAFMMTQLRHHNEIELLTKKQEKDVPFLKKLFQRNKPKSCEVAERDTEVYKSEVPIRIESGVQAIQPQSVTLRPTTKAKNLMALFPPTTRSSPETTLCLFEVGGNIGERRLHPDTSMLELYRVNPKARWLVKLDTH